MRKAIAVIVGYALWTLLWLGGNALFFSAAAVVGAGHFYGEPGALLGVIALSVVCSLTGGLVCARIARASSSRPALVLGALLLVTGIAVQASVWSLMPTWYHLTFLVLVIPASLLGARLAPAP